MGKLFGGKDCQCSADTWPKSDRKSLNVVGEVRVTDSDRCHNRGWARLKMTIVVGGVDMVTWPHHRWLANAGNYGGSSGKSSKNAGKSLKKGRAMLRLTWIVLNLPRGMF